MSDTVNGTLNGTIANITANSTSNATVGYSADPVIVERYRDIGIVLFVLFNVVLWPSLILFLARRKLFPVANRFPYQVVALDAVLLIWTTSLCFRLIYRFDYTCGLLVWLEDTMTLPSLTLYAVRILVIWVRFKVVGQTSGNFWTPELTDALRRLASNRTRKSSIATMSSSYGGGASSSGCESEEDLSSSPHTPAEPPFLTSPPLSPRSGMNSGMTTPAGYATPGGCTTPGSATVPGSPGGADSDDAASWRRDSWFRERYWILSSWSIGSLILAILVVFYIPFIYFTIRVPNMISADLLTCPRNTNIVYVITVEWVALMACMLGMGAKLLPQVKENLGMKTEIATIVTIGTGIIIFGTILVTLPVMVESSRNVFPAFTLIIATGNIVVVIVSTLIPALRSFPDLNERFHLAFAGCQRSCGKAGAEKEAGIELGEDFSTKKVVFADVLADVSSMNHFRKFLEKEFALENLFFYCETLEWKSKAESGDPKSVPMAIDIVKRFLLPGSPMEVNLPKIIVDQQPLKEFMAQMQYSAPAYGLLAMIMKGGNSANSTGSSDLLVARIRHAPPELFDLARRHVYELMESDSYRRFLYSDDYVEMVKSRKNKAARRRAAKKSDKRNRVKKISTLQTPAVPPTLASARMGGAETPSPHFPHNDDAHSMA